MGDYRHAFARNVTETVLDLVQDEHEGAWPVLKPRRDRFHYHWVESVLILILILVHGQLRAFRV
jgi:hypothetical protein